MILLSNKSNICKKVAGTLFNFSKKNIKSVTVISSKPMTLSIYIHEIHCYRPAYAPYKHKMHNVTVISSINPFAKGPAKSNYLSLIIIDIMTDVFMIYSKNFDVFSYSFLTHACMHAAFTYCSLASQIKNLR